MIVLTLNLVNEVKVLSYGASDVKVHAILYKSIRKCNEVLDTMNME